MMEFISNPYHHAIFILILTNIVIFEGAYRKIRQLEQRLSASPLKLRIVPDYEPSVDGWLALDIYNDSDNEFRECYVTLESVTKEGDAHYKIDHPTRLLWSSRNKPTTGNKRIIAGGMKRIDLARTATIVNQSKRMVFWVEDGDHYASSAGNFHTVIKITGSYNKTHFERSFALDFTYKGDEVLECDMYGKQLPEMTVGTK